MGTSRRPHTKTRHGCNTCKARKVRCDEEKPICRNCTRGNRECSYPEHLLTLSNVVVNTTDAQDQVFPLRDMELLHQYTSSTYALMSPEVDHYWIWQVYVPKLAFQHRFLLHGILASTALHRRYLAPESEKEAWMNLARYHQQHALTLYIPLLQTINEDTCHALFAFSLVLGVLCFGMLHATNEGPHALLRQLLDVFHALIGTFVVCTEAKQWLYKGEFGPAMASMLPQEHDFVNLRADSKRALEILVDCADRVCDVNSVHAGEDIVSKKRLYLKAINALATVLSTSPGKRQQPIVISWPVMAGSEFMGLVKHRDPLALIIVAHYGVALHWNSRLWMLGGLGTRVIEAVTAEVDASWKPYLTWARDKISEPVTHSNSPDGDNTSWEQNIFQEPDMAQVCALKESLQTYVSAITL